MNPLNDELFDYLRHLQTYIESQNKKIRKMEKEMRELQKEVNTIKKQRSVHVDKIEYKFDQLKVETLEGTLNIGLTPNGTGEIEAYAVDGKLKEDITFPIEKKHAKLAQAIKEEMDQYLQHEGKKVIRQAEEKYAYPLDRTYQQLIIEDIKKQMDQQIQLYLNQTNETIDGTNMAKIKQSIVDHIKKDVRHAIESFINHLPKKEED